MQPYCLNILYEKLRLRLMKIFCIFNYDNRDTFSEDSPNTVLFTQFSINSFYGLNYDLQQDKSSFAESDHELNFPNKSGYLQCLHFSLSKLFATDNFNIFISNYKIVFKIDTEH